MMVDKTLQQLVTAVERHLYQVAGAGVQLYAEDVIVQKLQECYTLLFDNAFLKRYDTYETRTLDGVTGEVTVGFAYIKTTNDIHQIFPGTSQHALTSLPRGMNPGSVTGTRPRYYVHSNTPTKLIRVVPLTAEGNVTVVGRTRVETPWTMTTVIPMDETALVYMAAWHYMTDDGANSAAAATLQNLFETRLKQLKLMNNGNIKLNPYSHDMQNEWATWP